MFFPKTSLSCSPVSVPRFNSANADQNYVGMELYKLKNYIILIFLVVTCNYLLTEFVNELILGCSVTLKGTKKSDIAYLF
jgi:hypothetical protein